MPSSNCDEHEVPKFGCAACMMPVQFATTNLGPSPAENALSLLRQLWESVGMFDWPTDYAQPLQRAEERASTTAHHLLRSMDPEIRTQGRSLNCVALACEWVSMAMVARSSKRSDDEKRLADRAIECLRWSCDGH